MMNGVTDRSFPFPQMSQVQQKWRRQFPNQDTRGDLYEGVLRSVAVGCLTFLVKDSPENDAEPSQVVQRINCGDSSKSTYLCRVLPPRENYHSDILSQQLRPSGYTNLIVQESESSS